MGFKCESQRDSNAKVKLWQIEQTVGRELIEVEYQVGDQTVSGSDWEIILHFSGGKELLIYPHDDGSVVVEGD